MPAEADRRGPVAALMIALIRVYQLTISALLGRTCRHLPTCSDYTSEAIRRHGAWRGFWLGLSRILRCSPIGTHGFDPVPEHLPDHGWRFWLYGRWRAR
ncbi:MAG: membrane protein insertion efficiency factor YidD [Aestuariivirgaceae bacterium]